MYVCSIHLMQKLKRLQYISHRDCMQRNKMGNVQKNVLSVLDYFYVYIFTFIRALHNVP